MSVTEEKVQELIKQVESTEYGSVNAVPSEAAWEKDKTSCMSQNPVISCIAAAFSSPGTGAMVGGGMGAVGGGAAGFLIPPAWVAIKGSLSALTKLERVALVEVTLLSMIVAAFVLMLAGIAAGAAVGKYNQSKAERPFNL
jgi:hypothetical protein